jgi:hypothetical protein
LATYKPYIPTKKEAWQFFAIWVCLVNSIAVYSLLRESRSLILRFTISDIIGSVAYTLSFALLESVGLFVVLSVLNGLIPERWTPGKAVVRGFLMALLLLFGLLAITLIVDFRGRLLLLTGAVALIGIAILLFRYERFLRVIVGLLDRLEVLASLYIVLDLVGLVIVILRNL